MPFIPVTLERPVAEMMCFSRPAQLLTYILIAIFLPIFVQSHFEQPSSIAIIFFQINQLIASRFAFKEIVLWSEAGDLIVREAFHYLAESAGKSNLCNSCNRHVIIGGMFYCSWQHLGRNNRRVSRALLVKRQKVWRKDGWLLEKTYKQRWLWPIPLALVLIDRWKSFCSAIKPWILNFICLQTSFSWKSWTRASQIHFEAEKGKETRSLLVFMSENELRIAKHVDDDIEKAIRVT